jgi:hypothetical protein
MKTSVARRGVRELRCLPVVLLAIGVVAWAGCSGSSGPQRYRVSGAVTHGGKPVPAGQIIFEPDSSKRNTGPQGYAEIRDGKYHIASTDKGVVGGAYRIHISGYDRFSQDENNPAKPLFPEYVTTVDLPKQDSTRDIDVPAASK